VGIFISYRREDTEDAAGRLLAGLREKLGKDRVFMDITGIEWGKDFRTEIDRALSTSDALLAVIGRNWATVEEGGVHRLDDPRDFVRIEIAAALKRGIPVIPVLVQGAAMPKPEQLPADLESLAWRNATELRHARWDADVESLAEVLRRMLPGTADPQPTPPLLALPEGAPSSPSVEAGLKPAPSGGTGVDKPQTLRFLPQGLIGAVIVALGVGAFVLWPRGIEMPSLLGQSLEQARRTVQEAGLHRGGEVAFASNRTPGTIIDQKPLAGEHVRPDTVVDLSYAIVAPAQAPFPNPPAGAPPTAHSASGPDEVASTSVPNVIGMPQAKAATLMDREFALKTTVVQEFTDKSVPGMVLRQSPLAGSKVMKGSHVQLVVAAEPAIRVPDLSGRNVTSVEALLRAADLKMGITVQTPTSSAQPGTVLAQEPAADTRVARGSTVRLTVAAAVAVPDAVPETTRVPRITGANISFAQTTLEKLGLVLGSVSRAPDPAVPEGLVTQQNRDPDEVVKKGARIDVVVSSGPPTVSTPPVAASPVFVPNVLCLSQKDAISALNALGLRAQVTDTTRALRCGGTGYVMRQKPTAGNAIDANGVVLIEVQR